MPRTGPTAIFFVELFRHEISWAPSWWRLQLWAALVPIIQPPVIRAITTKKERMIRMPYEAKEISRTVCILFPLW